MPQECDEGATCKAGQEAHKRHSAVGARGNVDKVNDKSWNASKGRPKFASPSIPTTNAIMANVAQSKRVHDFPIKLQVQGQERTNSHAKPGVAEHLYKVPLATYGNRETLTFFVLAIKSFLAIAAELYNSSGHSCLCEQRRGKVKRKQAHGIVHAIDHRQPSHEECGACS